MSGDTIARAAEVINTWTGSRARASGKKWGPYPAAEALAAAGLLATPPDDTTAKLIEAALYWRQYPYPQSDAGYQLARACNAYLAAHPERLT